jgi:hypothetical protein
MSRLYIRRPTEAGPLCFSRAGGSFTGGRCGACARPTVDIRLNQRRNPNLPVELRAGCFGRRLIIAAISLKIASPPHVQQLGMHPPLRDIAVTKLLLRRMSAVRK